MNKPNLYWLTNKNREKEVHVDKINDNKYSVLEFGAFKPIITSTLVLVDNSIAAILHKYVSEQISPSNKVTIWRKSTDETWTNYSEIEVSNKLDLESFENAKYDGFRIYQLPFNELYISAALKEKIESEYERSIELDFTNDWPQYAGD